MSNKSRGIVILLVLLLSMIKRQAEIDTLKIDKQALVKKDDANMEELKKIIQKMAVLEGEKEYNCIEACIKVKKVLNDEQRKKLREVKHKKQEKHGNDAK